MTRGKSITSELIIAAAAVLAALGLRGLLIPILGDRLPFVTAFGGVAVAAFFCRWQISVAAALILFVFGGLLMAGDPASLQIAGAFGYAVSTGLIVLMSEMLRRERNRSERLARDLTEKQEQLENFIAVVSHELRTPLSAMQGAAATLSSSPSEDIVHATVPMLERQIGHMRRLVDDLLDIARAQRGELTLVKQPVDVKSVVEQAIEMCQPYIAEKYQTLAWHARSGNWTVLGDRTRLVQMVSNLIHNATKFSPRQSEIRVEVLPSDGSVEIVVEDQGVGLQDGASEKLFMPFGKRRASGDYSSTGLGIGLSIVRYLAELHGGTVRSENKSNGRGARFTIRLPLQG